MIPSNKTNKLLGLEIIRFVSAFAVLIWHYQHFFYVVDKPINFIRENQPFYSFLSFFYDYGFFGVQVFWCISGFIFFWKYRNVVADKAISAKNFFNFRFSRLYPLHFSTLLLVAFLQMLYFSQQKYFFVYQDNDFIHFILQLFLASNWGMESGFSFNGPIWSISVEVVIYLIFFLMLRYVSKSYLLNISILFFYLIAQYFKISSSIVECLAYFYMGGLSAIALQYFDKSRFKHIVNTVAIFLVIIIPLIAFNTPISQYNYFNNLFLLAYIPLLIFVCAKEITAPPSIQSAIEAAGNMTYSSYLIHFPIQILIALYFLNMNQSIPYYNNIFFIGFILITLISSYFIYTFFELPAQNFFRKRLK